MPALGSLSRPRYGRKPRPVRRGTQQSLSDGWVPPARARIFAHRIHLREAVFVPFGEGNNGKLTMLTIVREIAIEYSVLIQVETLMTRQESSTAQEDLAKLRGARFVQTSETEEGQRISQGKLKRITQGMGDITATRKYEHSITFPETHKLFIDTNRRRRSGTPKTRQPSTASTPSRSMSLSLTTRSTANCPLNSFRRPQVFSRGSCAAPASGTGTRASAVRKPSTTLATSGKEPQPRSHASCRSARYRLTEKSPSQENLQPRRPSTPPTRTGA